MTRDELLTKAMGKCWHFWVYYNTGPRLFNWYYCTVKGCKATWGEDKGELPKTDYIKNPADFVSLLLWSQDDARTYVNQGGPEKWTWEEFDEWAYEKWLRETDAITGPDWRPSDSNYTRWLFNPERFAPILAEFLGWREGK